MMRKKYALGGTTMRHTAPIQAYAKPRTDRWTEGQATAQERYDVRHWRPEKAHIEKASGSAP